MVGHVQTLVVEMVAVAHAAAVKSLVGKALFEIREDLVALFLIEVFGRGLGVVVAELHRDIILAPALGVIGQLIGRIIHVQHAVHALGRCDAGNDLIGRFFNVLRQMTGNVDAGDLVAVALGEGEHLFCAASGLHGEGRVDIHLMRGRNRVEHALECLQVGKRLAAGKYKVAVRRDLIHHGDALKDRLNAEPLSMGVLLLVHAEGAVVPAVIRHKYRYSCAALARLIGMSHWFLSVLCQK